MTEPAPTLPSRRSTVRDRVALACVAGLSLTALSGLQQGPGEVFRRLDRDGNGRLSRDELPERARANFEKADTDGSGDLAPEEDVAFRRRYGGPSTPPSLVESVRVIENVPYAGNDSRRQRLDLLVPKRPKGNGPLPVVIFIHGGAWRGGDRRDGYSALGPLVATGHYAGITVGYRLTDEAIWPAQVHDAKAAVRWARANAGRFNLDPDRIGAMGPSAGGHLVAMLGTSGEVVGLEGDVGPHSGTNSRVQCVADLYGPAELSRMGLFPSALDHDDADSPESRLIGGPLLSRPEAARAASPVTYVTPDDPPFLIVHGTKDEIVPFDQSVRLHEALRKAGVDATMVPVERGGHGNFGNPELPLRVQAFFDRHLRGMDVPVPDDPLPTLEPPAKRKGLFQ